MLPFTFSPNPWQSSLKVTEVKEVSEGSGEVLPDTRKLRRASRVKHRIHHKSSSVPNLKVLSTLWF